MEPAQEMLDILHRALAKLQALPQAGALEIGAFAVILIFAATFIGMAVIACSSCCIGKVTKPPKRIQPV